MKIAVEMKSRRIGEIVQRLVDSLGHTPVARVEDAEMVICDDGEKVLGHLKAGKQTVYYRLERKEPIAIFIGAFANAEKLKIFSLGEEGFYAYLQELPQDAVTPLR